jgi:hypothetical protein
MKTLVAVILAFGVGFAAAYVIASKQKATQLEQLQAQPSVAAAPAPAPVEKVIMAAAPAAPAEESAQDILDDLLNVKLGTASARNTGLRMVVFKLETLMQRGKLAVPAIRSFIGRNVDVDYNQQETPSDNANQADASVANNDQNNNNGNRGNNRPGRVRNNQNNGGFFGGGNNFRGGARRARNLEILQADWVVPPSLRLGLVGTLKEIGGAESEQALAEMLSGTGRGVEVAYLTVILEEITPGKYRDAAIAAAKELLMNPPSVDSPDSLDQLSKSYLYGVLEFYKDTSFAVNAQQMLVGADGRLDQDALDYLATVLKDQSVSALYAAYENPALTNQFDKMRVSSEVLKYVGQNSQANQMFTETLNNPDVDARMKALMIIQQAGGGFGQSASDTPADPQIVAGKLGVLNSVQSNDPTVSKALAATINALKNPDQPVQLQDVFGGGGRGGFGGGGNNNANNGN